MLNEANAKLESMKMELMQAAGEVRQMVQDLKTINWMLQQEFL
jgi:hypothetical protein